MKMARLVQAASIGAAVLLMAASASATTITYTTNAAGTEFVAPIVGLTLNQSSGAAATLTFEPNVSSTTGVPSNVNLGNFLLTCATCTASSPTGTFAFFNAFTFDLVVTDTTAGQNGSGTFVGSSTGGFVYSDASGLTITWAPLILGPGTTNLNSGNMGPTSFSTTVFTGIAAPNSGTVPDVGTTTVQGFVNTTSAVPEPASLGLMGGALLGLGLLRRKRLLRGKRV